MTLEEEIDCIIDNFYEKRKSELEDVSKHIWSNPELSGEEFKAHDLLTDILEKEGFVVSRQYLGFKTAFKAVLEQTSGGPSICIVCEYDALPEVGHACGHNLIAQAGLGAALAVKEYLQSSQIAGKIIALGCPAEERGSFKVPMLEKGAFEDAHLVMMVHPHSASSELNTNLLGKHHFVAEFRGAAAHAAGAPWEGRNALDGAVAAYQSLSFLRQQIHPTSKIHSIIKNGGTAINIIPDFASMEVCVRSPSLPHLDKLRKQAEKCVEGAAMQTNTDLKLSYPLPSLLPLNSNRVLSGIFQKFAEPMGMVFADITGIGERFAASSDIGTVSWSLPTIQPAYHISTEGPNHSKEFTAAAATEEAQIETLKASKAMAKTALFILRNTQLVEEMWSYHKETKH